MAYTNLDLITDALREINVINEVQVPSDEQGAQSLVKLNQMMELLKEKSIRVGWFEQTELSDACPLPDWARLGITAALAMRLAPQYGASISPELLDTYKESIPAMRRKCLFEASDNADMSHMPSGSASRGRYDINNQ